MLRTRFQGFAKEVVKSEGQRLSKAIWTIREMYEEEVKPDKKDLLIICEDLLVKILAYL